MLSRWQALLIIDTEVGKWWWRLRCGRSTCRCVALRCWCRSAELYYALQCRRCGRARRRPGGLRQAGGGVGELCGAVVWRRRRSRGWRRRLLVALAADCCDTRRPISRSSERCGRVLCQSILSRASSCTAVTDDWRLSLHSSIRQRQLADGQQRFLCVVSGVLVRLTTETSDSGRLHFLTLSQFAEWKFGLRTCLDQSMYLVGLNFGLSRYLDHTFGLDFYFTFWLK